MISPPDKDDLAGRIPTIKPLDQTDLILVDIGNSRIGIAGCRNGKRAEAKHLAAAPIEPVGRLLLEMWNLSNAKGRAVVVSSVNPPLLKELEAFCRTQAIAPLLVVGRDIDAPIAADVNEPEKIGTDRLCVAAAAFEKTKQACVVADLGTAITIDLVADNGIFLGGTILPGITLMAQALHEHTAQLPLVEVGAPTEVLGKDTVGAIRNGIFAMAVGALREITERYATDIGKWPVLVLTGGDAAAIASTCEFVDKVIPDLSLDGLVIAYRKAAGEAAEEE